MHVGRYLEDGIGEPVQRVGLELLGVRARHDTQVDRRVRREVGGAAGPDVVPQRGRPGAGVQPRPRTSGPAPSPVNSSLALLPNHSGPRKPPATER